MANRYGYGSGPGQGGQPLSRANSFTSGQMGGSQANDSEDDDSDGAKSMGGCGAGGGGGQGSSSLSYKDRRREAHTQAEQKRRDAIKKGYDYLQDLVPACGSSASGSSGGGVGAGAHEEALAVAKISKALVLQKTIDYIQQIQQQKQKQEEELVLLRKEATALEIMRKNYEQLVKSHTMRNNAAASGLISGSHDAGYVSAEVKFQVFQLLMDSMFRSFNEKVPMNNFSELSGCVFNWLEECCKPPLLQELMMNVLQQVKSDYLKEQHEEDHPMTMPHSLMEPPRH